MELLRGFDSKGDHGVHAVVPTPDGKDFFLVCGNNAILTETEPTSPVPTIWGEDHLLPRMPDGRGHNRHVLAPGGIIYRVSPDGKKFEVYASGFRNVYDAAVNHAGELERRVVAVLEQRDAGLPGVIRLAHRAFASTQAASWFQDNPPPLQATKRQWR